MDSEDGAGALVIVGGGGTPDVAVQRAIALAGGFDARIVVLPQASSREDRGESTVRMFQDAGARNVTIVEFEPIAEARQALANADLIWMPGGSQNRLAEAIREAGLDEWIRSRNKDGAVVGGTSAGAAIQSKQMLTGDADLESVTIGATELAEGLGLWTDAIVDQHFLKRRRNNRLLSAVLDRPELIGVGIDERTAVVVTGRHIEVIGDGNILVYDARTAEVMPGEPGERSAATGLQMHVLRQGMAFEY